MTAPFKPYVPDEANVAELTVRAAIMGAFAGISVPLGGIVADRTGRR